MPSASAREASASPGARPTPPTAERQRLRALVPTLRLRAAVGAAIRDYFSGCGFLDVQTPVRVRVPALEDYIDAEAAGDAYLRTSPELHMKRLLAAGCTPIYQLGPCFRQGERGRNHLPEFTMLEWYRLNASCADLLRDTEGLLRHVAHACVGRLEVRFRGRDINLAPPWEEASLDDLFRRHADQDLDAAVASGRFEELLVERVEPHLGLARPTVVSGYPLAVGGLARRLAANPSRVERWELYIAGLEVANACVELTDPDEQRRRFEACAELRRSQGRPAYPLDEAFLAALEEGMPAAAGIAVGVDRLLMVMAGAETIADVVAFPEE